MATVKKEIETVPELKFVDVERELFHLTMDRDEAETVNAILRHVGGSPSRSPRKHADAIKAALGKVLNLNEVADRLVQRQTGGIYFRDYDTTSTAATPDTTSQGAPPLRHPWLTGSLYS